MSNKDKQQFISGSSGKYVVKFKHPTRQRNGVPGHGGTGSWEVKRPQMSSTLGASWRWKLELWQQTEKLKSSWHCTGDPYKPASECLAEGVQARATAVLQLYHLRTAQRWGIFLHFFWENLNISLRKLWSPLSILCSEPKQDITYRIWTIQERAISKPVHRVLYTAEIRQNPTEPACTVPPCDTRQAAKRTPSSSPENLQLLCEAGNQRCYAVNGTMEGPADKTGKSGVQHTHAKSLKGCSWRKDKLAGSWVLVRRQSWSKTWKNKGGLRTWTWLGVWSSIAGCELCAFGLLQCVFLSCHHIWNKIISKMQSTRTHFQYLFLIDA